MRQDYKVLSFTIIIFTSIYVGGILLFGGVDANSTEHCIPNGERWTGWECLPENRPICPNWQPKSPCSIYWTQ